ncbi:PEP-CTERM sorting domain-containing protein [Crocosphaera sp. XPORK-15E]|uniref:PEP-CTERM sorting domain-containing protein n=1 Tax=Crocosphaera sp. XPORK-15E TaxID=3110247 RepID=UPI002B21E185|nr:PEP-CTERM sorting domain-containing protein [Crocosphaera sp. XPORK-15E]MEA5535911.1 PEP-CTERM sorting domain-containing protein [Crocosphaera sp. XPORK-15E]
MKTLTKLALGTVVASTGLMVGYAPAQAALLGDTVSAELIGIGVGTILNQTATVVDPGIEFTVFGNQGANLNLDVKSDSFDIIYNLTTLPGIGFPSRWILSDLDWVDAPGIVTGVTLTSGNASLISGISFTDDSITIDLLDVTNPPPSQTWSFAIQAQHETVPEPGTILGLLTLAGLGLGSRFKRNVG